ncbi:helix-turn-helix transcriptional regulator [Streptomyces sp. NPDC048417]|uniref:helix-turn-helix domain-containing protein n=1 Tax=Streptomyces sp. NPDC048417 TaxID=3155387 RepID=UPI00342A7C73
MTADRRTHQLFALSEEIQVLPASASERSEDREADVWEGIDLRNHNSYTGRSGRSVRRCRRCQCILSRYNEDSYCGSCARNALSKPRVVPTVPAEVWNRADIQAALFARDFGQLCHLVRIASGLRQSDMADLTGLSQAFLSMLESGGRRLTNIDKIVELLAGLNIPADLAGPTLLPTTESAEEAYHAS